MANMLRCGGEIIRPDPDSHFGLIPCDCGHSDVAYSRCIKLPYRVEWVAGCLACGKTTRAWTAQHTAQIEWNGRERPSWERD